MRREDFHARLLAATFTAMRFGQRYIASLLSINVRYIVAFNQSYDETHKEDENVCPADDGRVEYNLSDVAALDLLHRDGRCPQWIDISVAGADEETTVLRLLCCGRYHGDEKRLYYYETGLQPFGIKSPDLPPGWKEGEKFKVPEPGMVLIRK